MATTNDVGTSIIDCIINRNLKPVEDTRKKEKMFELIQSRIGYQQFFWQIIIEIVSYIGTSSIQNEIEECGKRTMEYST